MAAAQEAGQNKHDIAEEFVKAEKLDAYMDEFFGESSMDRNIAIGAANQKINLENQEKQGLIT